MNLDQEASKKIYRWQVAMRAWSQMNGYGMEDSNASNLLRHLAQALTIGEFNLSSLLFYFRMDSDEPHEVKKNRRPMGFNKHTKRIMIYKSGDLARAETSMIAQMQLQARGQRIVEPFQGRLWMMAHFYFPRERYYTKAGEVSETLPDLSNLLELPQDCMQPAKVCKTGKRKGRTIRQGAGIISNDSHIDSLDGCRRLPWDSIGYRLEIFLLRYGGHNGSGSTNSTGN